MEDVDKVLKEFDKYFGSVIEVRGRLTYNRGPFFDLEGAEGCLQIYAGSDFQKSHKQKLRSGNIVRVRGKASLTKKGSNPYIAASELEVLATPEVPFRNVPADELSEFVSASYNRDQRAILIRSHRITNLVRRFFYDRGFVEVFTPVLQTADIGTSSRPFHVREGEYLLRRDHDLETRAYLLAMDKIFQIGPVFRNEGTSKRYKKEFVLMNLFSNYSRYSDLARSFLDLLRFLGMQGFKETPESIDVVNFEESLSGSPPTQVNRADSGLVDLIEQKAKALKGTHTDYDWSRYRKEVKSKLVRPTLVIGLPRTVCPTSKMMENGYLEDFEFIWKTRTIVHGATEENEASGVRLGSSDGENRYRSLLRIGFPPFAGACINIESLVQTILNLESVSRIHPSFLT